MNRIKIAYILSVGHSGSSLLDVLLGLDENAISIGEVKVNSDGFMSNILCTCGAPVSECKFWQKVDHRLSKMGKSLFNIRLAGRPESVIPEDIVSFYQNICAESGAKLIVDSSKSISRLRALHHTSGELDLRIIFLERTPYGVVASNYRKGRSWFRHTFMYLMNNASKKQFADSYNPLYVKYEEIVKDPKLSLSRIYRYLDIEKYDIESSEIDLVSEKHMLGGNSMLYKPLSEIKEDLRWKSELSFIQKLVIGVACNVVVQNIIYWAIGRIRSAKDSSSSSGFDLEPS